MVPLPALVAPLPPRCPAVVVPLPTLLPQNPNPTALGSISHLAAMRAFWNRTIKTIPDRTHGKRFRHYRGRGAARAEDAQGIPTQSRVSPSILVYADYNTY